MEALRAWVITILYGVLGVISFLILYGCYQVFNATSDIPLILYALAFVSFTSGILNVRAALAFFRRIKEQRALNRLDLWPFLMVSITLVIAIRFFSGL